MIQTELRPCEPSLVSELNHILTLQQARAEVKTSRPRPIKTRESRDWDQTESFGVQDEDMTTFLSKKSNNKAEINGQRLVF